MTIRELITLMKSKHHGVWNGTPIDESKTRDKILYGNPDVECTGIVTTCFASTDVIRKAHELGANFIICHEALFWNHGDHTEWLSENKTFQAKKKLLDETGIVVWRNHDYIHSGIWMENQWVDGIFYGLMQVMGWQKYLACDLKRPMVFEFEDATVESLAQEIIQKMELDGLRILGKRTGSVKKLMIVSHLIGPQDNQILASIEENDVDAIITMEMTDFTVNEYMRDSAMLGRQKTIFAAGHFNTEEPGMKYFAEYLPQMIGTDYKITYIQSGDVFGFIEKAC
ncbi:MAG: Nif3-like dinuclear metal center hexameric protein [Erysipelotrichaceae bacterium]|nr:Nif3-like dinuclear metal center hexameric protein [Erysipelotrichaceae bacterium]